MSSLTTTRFDFAFHLLEKSILWNVADAKLSLGLDAGDTIKEYRSHAYIGPTFIATCRINGWQELDMYDEHPGFAYFRSDCRMIVDLEAVSMDQACDLLSSQFLNRHWYSRFPGNPDDDELDSDMDSPSSGFRSIDLLDNLGNEVATATIDQDGQLHWATTGHVDVISNLEEASRLDSEASFESGWDNFETARQLRAEATALRKEVSIAIHRDRLAA